MKKTLTFLFLLAPPAGIALAEEENHWYAGAGIGFMTVTAGGFSSNDPINADVVAGYRLPAYSNWSIEGTYTTTISDGELFKDIGFANEPGDHWDIRTWGVYGAFRTSGTGYFKARAGFAGDDITVATKAGEVSDKRASLSAGVGAGWDIGKFTVEADYTYIEKDVAFIGLTLLRRF